MLIKQVYFLDKGFSFQPNVCNRYHDLLMMPMKLSDVATSNIKKLIIAVLLADLEKLRP